MRGSSSGLSPGECLIALLVIAIFVAFKGGIGYLIGRNKGRGGLGFVLGLILGIIGWIIVACLSPVDAPRPATRRRRRPSPRASATGFVPCPYCAEQVRVGATLCRYCKSEIAT